jgi:hypothetical protein
MDKPAWPDEDLGLAAAMPARLYLFRPTLPLSRPSPGYVGLEEFIPAWA